MGPYYVPDCTTCSYYKDYYINSNNIPVWQVPWLSLFIDTNQETEAKEW